MTRTGRIELPPGISHGSHKGYNRGCRCEGEGGCKTHRSAYDRARYHATQGAARKDPEYRAAVVEEAAQRRDERREKRRRKHSTTVWNLRLESAVQEPEGVAFATRTTVSEATYHAVSLRYATERMAVKEFGRRYGGRPVVRAVWSEEHIHQDEIRQWRKP